MRKKFFKLLKVSWPILVIILAILAFFYPVWLRGLVPLPADFVVGVYYPWLDYKWGFPTGVPVKNPMTTDVVSFTYPMQMLAMDLLKNGQWPLWNPYILAGTPLLANFQSAPFSPTNFVYFIFDRLTAWSIQIILQHVLAAFFTYLLLRYWKVSRAGAVFGGITFAFAGFNLLWSQWNGHALSSAFIPLVLLFEARLLDSGQVKNGIGVSFVLALQMLSGYPQVVIYTAVGMLLLWLVRVWGDSKWFVKTTLLGIFSVLGVGLAAFQILPGAELLSLSQRDVEPHPFEWAFLPWVKIITIFAPDYFGNHATQNYWGPQDYTSNTGFIGVVAFILASLAVMFLKKSKHVLFCLLLGIIALLLAFPTPISVGIWKSGFLGLQAASAHRSLVLLNLSIALLAGFGADRFLSGDRLRARLAFLIPYLVIGGFTIVTLYLFLESKQVTEAVEGIPKYTVGLRNLIFPIATLLLASVVFLVRSRKIKLRRVSFIFLLILTCLELFRFGWKFTPFSPRHIVFPTTPILDFLTNAQRPVRVTGSSVIPINMRMPYKIESLEGYDAVYPLRISQFLAAMNGQKGGTDPLGRYGTVDNETSHLLDLVNTEYYLVIKKDKENRPSPKGNIPNYFDKNRFTVAFEDRSVSILESRTVLPRAFVVYSWDKVASDREVINLLLDKGFPIREKVLLEEDVPFQESVQPQEKSSVKFLSYVENESRMQVETSADGLLFVSDTWYPGWKAYVDGKETKIYRANFAFRAIPVTSGAHDVRFSYQPDSFYNGLKVSLISLFALGIISLGYFFKKRTQHG